MRSAFHAWQQVSQLGNYVDIVQSPQDKAVSWMNAQPFLLSIMKSMWQRLPFITKSHKMGITARGVKQGDIFCPLYGTNVPFILRNGAE